MQSSKGIRFGIYSLRFRVKISWFRSGRVSKKSLGLQDSEIRGLEVSRPADLQGAIVPP